MKTVGEILYKARMEKQLSLLDVHKRTRISMRYLRAIEANDYQSLPPATFTKGFMQNYARVVGVDEKTIRAIFRRDFDQDERGRIIPRGLAEPVKASFNIFTPRTTAIAVSTAIGVIVLAFFIRHVVIFISAPKLAIITPYDNQILQNPVSVMGETHSQASVTINKEPVTVDAQGQFQANINLGQGMQLLIVESTSRSGKTTQERRSVTIE